MKKYRLKSFFIIFSLLLLSFVVFFVRFSMLQKSTEANGLDGYFYALQAKSFVETGHLENPSYELGYYLCGFCSFFTKNSIVGVKVYSAISSCFVSIAAFLILFELSNSFFLSITAFLLSAASPVFSSMSLNYINNQTGICFFLFYVFFVIKFIKSKSIKWLFLSFIFFLFSILSHKITLIYSLAFTIFILIPLIKKYSMQFFKGLKKTSRIFLILLISAFLLFSFIMLFLFFKRHSPRFINAFSFPTLPLINHRQLSLNVTNIGSFEITFYYLALYIIAFIALIKKKQINILIMIPVLFFPFLNLDSDMGIRLFISAVPVCIPLLLFELHLLSGSFCSKKLEVIIGSILGVFLTFALFFTPRVYNPKNDPPYKYYRKIVADINLDKDSLLIAHLGLNHVYTYYNDLKDALNWLPDFKISSEKTWRLAYGVNYSYIKDFLKGYKDEKKLSVDLDKCLFEVDQKYILLREDLWQFYLNNEDEEIAETYKNWFNPYEVRPQYIRKHKLNV